MAQISAIGTLVTKQPHNLRDGLRVKRSLFDSEGAVTGQEQQNETFPVSLPLSFPVSLTSKVTRPGLADLF